MNGKRKLVRTCLASLLCVCLIASCMGNMAIAFAGKWDEVPADKKVNYVTLGDSMSAGMGLPGYRNGGYLEIAPDAYPAQVAEHYGWSLTQLATSGMRAEDLHYILTYGEEGGYPGDAWTEYELLNKGRWPNPDEVAATFQNAVAEADVISAAVGNANFSVFFPALIPSLTGAAPDGVDLSFATKENGLAGLDPDLKELVMNIHDGVMEYALTILPEEMAEELGNAVIFTVASYMRNYNRALDRIVELNPDVEIILFGLFNTASGFELDIVNDGVTRHISLADLRELLVQPINTYLAGWGALKQGSPGYENVKIYYAEAEPVKTLSPTYKEIYKNDETVIRDRFVTDIVEKVFPMVEMDLMDITLDDVKAYEAAFADGIPSLAAYDQIAGNKSISVAVYLALEGAILNSLDKDILINLDELDLDELKELSGDVLGLESFAGLMGKVTEELQSQVFTNAMNKMDEVKAALPEANSDTVARIALLCATTESVLAAFESDEMIVAALSLYGHTSLGSGMSSHPDQIGHDQMTDAIIEAYTGEHTPTDAAVDKVFKTMEMLKALKDSPYGPGKHGEYVIYEDSYYLAIDELYASDASYADKVAAELGIPYGKIAELDEEEVAKADLITVRYNNEPMINYMVDQTTKAMAGKAVDTYDWSAHVGETGAAYVQQAMAKVTAMLTEKGMDDLSELATVAVESYAYEYVGHLLGYIKDLKKIAEINPEAMVLSVSMNNVLADVVLTLDEEELALGKYIQYVVDAANLEAFSYVLFSGTAVYVVADDVETNFTLTNANLMNFITNVTMFPNDLKATGEGHAYIKDQICNALTVTVYDPSEDIPSGDDPAEDKPSEEDPPEENATMLGDADLDGDIDARDAALAYGIFNEKVNNATDQQLKNADVDGDGDVDARDAALIYAYFNGRMAAFPAE